MELLRDLLLDLDDDLPLDISRLTFSLLVPCDDMGCLKEAAATVPSTLDSSVKDPEFLETTCTELLFSWLLDLKLESLLRDGDLERPDGELKETVLIPVVMF